MRQISSRIFIHARLLVLTGLCMVMFNVCAVDSKLETVQSAVSLDTIKQSLERICSLDVQGCDKVSCLLEQIKGQLSEHAEYLSLDKQCSSEAYMQAMDVLQKNHQSIADDAELQSLVQAISVLDQSCRTKVSDEQDARAPRPGVSIPGAPLATTPELVDMPKDVTVERDLLVGANTTLQGNLSVSGSVIIVGPIVATDLTLSGNLVVQGNTTLGDADIDTITMRGATTINTAAGATAQTTIGSATSVTNVGGELNVAGQIHADGGIIDRSATGTLAVGGTNVTTLSLSRTGQTTDVLGNLHVTQNAVVTGTTTLTGVTTATGVINANGGVDNSTPAALALGRTTATSVSIGKSGTTAYTQFFGDIVLPASTATNPSTAGVIYTDGSKTAANRLLSNQGSQNIFVGKGSGNLATPGSDNAVLGYGAGSVVSGNGNTLIGNQSGQNLANGNVNTLVGHQSAQNLTTGIGNTIIGGSSGSAYTTSENNNIVIGASIAGVTGESNVIRLGNAQTHMYLPNGITLDTATGGTMQIAGSKSTGLTLGKSGATASLPGTVSLPGLTASLPLQLDGDKHVISSQVSLTTGVTGVLPIANGGTNSSTALNNQRIMISSSGAVIEAPALTNGQLLIGSTGATPEAATITGTSNQVDVTNAAGSITLSLPSAMILTGPSSIDTTTGILSLGGATTDGVEIGKSGATASLPGTVSLPGLTASLPLQLDGDKHVISSQVSLTTGVTGVLPIANGGTNSSTALNNQRIMISSSGAVIEAPALTDGQLLIGSTGATPEAATITGTSNQVDVTNAAGSITLSLPSAMILTGPSSIDTTTGILSLGGTTADSVEIGRAGQSVEFFAPTIIVPATSTIDTLAAGALSIGGATATKLNLSRTGITTEVFGDLHVAQNAVVDGTTTLTGATTATGVINADGGVDRSIAGTLSLGTTANVTQIDIGTSGATGPMNIGTSSDVTLISLGHTGSSTGAVKFFGDIVLPASSGNDGIIYTNGSKSAVNRFISNQGLKNTCIGENSGNPSGAGYASVCIGYHAGKVVTGGDNTCVGYTSGSLLTSGGGNVLIGSQTGGALTTGNNNVIIGFQGGSTLSTGTDNIFIGNNVVEGAATTNTLRIGASGNITRTFIAGIRGTGILAIDTPVYIDSNNQLGTMVSSRRFKENIVNMQDHTTELMALHPVEFNYISDQSKKLQVGLIAEEVEQVMPRLVVYDKDNQIETVRYHDLPVLLLQQVQKQYATIAALEARVAALEGAAH